MRACSLLPLFADKYLDQLWGGFVNSIGGDQSVPTYEFWPTRGDPVNSTFLMQTQPANLYPLTWLLPSGLVFMQADWQTT